MTSRHPFLAALLAVCLMLPAPVRAMTTSEATFDVYFVGIRAGVAAFKGIVSDTQYSVAGQLKSTGLLSAVRSLRYDVKARGGMRSGRFVPQRYEENNNNGKRTTNAVMEYVRGVPQLKRYDSPQDPGPYALDPSTQGGTLDPATALFAAMRDRPRAQTCNESIETFDGKRRSRISLGAPTAQGNSLVCNGEYRRVAGYAPWEMEDRTAFPFTITFSPGPGGLMRVSDVSVQTFFGIARLIRR